VQTLMGHHSVAFTMDQYADAWPEALTNAGEKAAALLFVASGSKTVAAEELEEARESQVFEKVAPPAGVERPLLSDCSRNIFPTRSPSAYPPSYPFV
jgi:hypothetical protein